MPISDSAGPERVLLDTSAAVAFVLPSHEAHHPALRRMLHATKGLAGHAVFETYSVLTRMPPPYRVPPPQAVALIRQNFPDSAPLSAPRSGQALEIFARAGVAGGAVYDSLVALAALEANRLLITCDRRAAPTYQDLGVSFEVLGPEE